MVGGGRWTGFELFVCLTRIAWDFCKVWSVFRWLGIKIQAASHSVVLFIFFKNDPEILSRHYQRVLCWPQSARRLCSFTFALFFLPTSSEVCSTCMFEVFIFLRLASNIAFNYSFFFCFILITLLHEFNTCFLSSPDEFWPRNAP